MVKTKSIARKVRARTEGTGGGPGGAGLTDQDNKVLEIVGSASVDGFCDLEVVIITF